MNFCRLEIGGRLTRDCVTKELPSGVTVTEFGVAFNRRYKKGDAWIEDPVFIDGFMWGKRGEAFARFHGKGDMVFLFGGLQLDQWEDKNGGGKRSRLRFAVEGFEFVGGKKERGGVEAVFDGDSDEKAF